ncbi:aldehyde dehydrogenase family protein, partial [Escherichia coli]|nr:aldehyde dehydrogenase family protein [Escherichia coli]
ITPLTALKLAELAKDIFPAGVINVLFGRGKTVGDPLTGHPKVRMVSLTGSIASGEHIISHTAPTNNACQFPPVPRKAIKGP